MIKLKILNLPQFLKTINECTGAINRIYPDGKREDINGHPRVQRMLQEEHKKNKGMLPLCLDIPNPKDYFRIVMCYVWDC